MTSPFRVLVTGSRDWQDYSAVFNAIEIAIDEARAAGRTDVVVVHGQCPTGADWCAGEYCEDQCAWWEGVGIALSEEPHPADWSIGKKAGPLRNQAMVDLGADVCLAFPLAGSRGTRHCMSAAEKAGIPVKVFSPVV